jgi:hypothetical protein
VLKQKGESKYQLQKKIFFPSSNREREEAIQRFNQQNMDVFIR